VNDWISIQKRVTKVCGKNREKSVKNL